MLFLKLPLIRTSILTVTVLLKLVGSPEVFFARIVFSVILDIFKVKFLFFYLRYNYLVFLSFLN